MGEDWHVLTIRLPRPGKMKRVRKDVAAAMKAEKLWDIVEIEETP